MHNHGLGSWMTKRRLKTPDKTAVVFDGRRISYRELADRADAISALLAAREIRKGDRVAFLGENSPDFVATLFGVAQLGAVFVPLNTRLAAPELEHALTDSGSLALIHDPEFTERLADAAARVPHRIVTGHGGLDALLDGRRTGHADAAVTLEDPVAIIYTSGTTGKPKGAILTHGNLTWAALNAIIDYDIVSTDVALMISPLFHVASLGMGLLPIAMKGGTIILEKKFEPGVALSLIQEHGISMLSGVPTTYQMLCDHPDWATTDVSTMRKLTCGGSAVPTRVLNAYEERGLSFSQGYGMTETSPGATSLPPTHTRTKQGSVGLPHFFCDVRIADEEGRMVPRGTVGEIEISGPNVFPGYHERPEANEAAFTDDGWFRSGDLGYLDADGFLHIADRLKDMIISGGENVYCAEVENVLAAHPAIVEVAVYGRADERWGEIPVAAAALRPEQELTAGELQEWLSDRLARFKQPKDLIVVPALPRNAAGKVDKVALRASDRELSPA